MSVEKATRPTSRPTSRPASRPARREPQTPSASARSSVASTKERPGPWVIPGRGLQTYSIGLVLRLVLGILFFIGLLLFASGGPSATRVVGIVFAIMSVSTGFVMLAGLSRFTRQPGDSPGRSSARFAATVLAITVGLELMCLGLSGMAALSGPNDHELALRFSAHVATLWKWAAALWLAHVGATIVAMWRLGPLVEKRPPTRGRFLLPVLVLAAGVSMFVTWNLALPSLGFGVTGTIMVISLSALLMLCAMAIYVAAIDHLSKRLRTLGKVQIPASKIHAS